MLDNAFLESVIGVYEAGCFRPGPFHAGPLKTVSDVEFTTSTWVEWWNNARLHSTIGYMTPAEAKAAHYAGLAASEVQLRPV